MTLPAAPIIIQSIAEIGSPGKTDSCHIWLGEELNKAELAVAKTHEESHVWLWHGNRGKAVKKLAPEKYNHALWNIAADMEIARNIYQPGDIAVVLSPRSRLKGGIIPDSIEGLPPELIYAEDIYNWLLENGQEQLLCCSCILEEAEGKSSESEPEAVESEVVARMREIKQKKILDKEREESEEARRQAQEELAKKLDLLYKRPPTLTEEISSALRVRHERPRSYARPGRRELLNGLVDKGRKNIAKPPLVEIYIDRSGSFCAAKTQSANDAVNRILARYKASIKSDAYFFGDNELRVKDTGAGGNTPYHLIVQNLERTRPKIAIVITDDDGCDNAIGKIPKQTTILCLPIGCAATQFSVNTGGKDVQF